MSPYQILLSDETAGAILAHALARRPSLPFTSDDVLGCYSNLSAVPIEEATRAADTVGRVATLLGTARFRLPEGDVGPAEVWGVALSHEGIPFAVRPYDFPFTIDGPGAVLVVPIDLRVAGGEADAT